MVFVSRGGGIFYTPNGGEGLCGCESMIGSRQAFVASNWYIVVCFCHNNFIFYETKSLHT